MYGDWFEKVCQCGLELIENSTQLDKAVELLLGHAMLNTGASMVNVLGKMLCGLGGNIAPRLYINDDLFRMGQLKAAM